MAEKINDGYVEGIDFSGEMVSVARKKNKKFIVTAG
jgi:ubiquinone/menaquinone biosynthesis C-methylase UbiE